MFQLVFVLNITMKIHLNNVKVKINKNITIFSMFQLMPKLHIDKYNMHGLLCDLK
jgi:hypothetical protein